MQASVNLVTAPEAKARTTSYQWLVLCSAFLGWLFDSADLNLFTLLLFPSVSQLLHTTNPAAVAQIGGLIMAIKLFAWGLGGIFFGVVADRIGRSRTMILTIMIYAVFTGLSALAQNWWELAAMQAVAGLGIGGEWSAGAALITESWPERSRARAMQIMQLAFSFGFFLAAIDNLVIGPLGGWRWVLAAGALPAVLTLVIRRYVPEPERWLKVHESELKAGAARPSAAGTFLAIFKPGLRRNSIVGVLVASSMMIGAWGGLTLLPSWIHHLLGPACGRHHQLCLHADDGRRSRRQSRAHLADGCDRAAAVLFSVLRRLAGRVALPLPRDRYDQRRAVVHDTLRLFCDRRFRDFRRLSAGTVPDPRAGDRARFLLERGALRHRHRAASRQRAGRLFRLVSGSGRFDVRFLPDRPGRHLVRSGDARGARG